MRVIKTDVKEIVMSLTRLIPTRLREQHAARRNLAKTLDAIGHNPHLAKDLGLPMPHKHDILPQALRTLW